MASRAHKKLPWEARVFSYEELYNLVKQELEALDEKLSSYIDTLIENEEFDTRDGTMKIVEFVHSLWSDRNPAVIVYFTPPYYPRVC